MGWIKTCVRVYRVAYRSARDGDGLLWRHSRLDAIKHAVGFTWEVMFG